MPLAPPPTPTPPHRQEQARRAQRRGHPMRRNPLKRLRAPGNRPPTLLTLSMPAEIMPGMLRSRPTIRSKGTPGTMSSMMTCWTSHTTTTIRCAHSPSLVLTQTVLFVPDELKFVPLWLQACLP